MNQKKAKRLRREAREQSVGLPHNSYARRVAPDLTNPGQLGPRHITDKCVRGIYKRLKLEASVK